MFRIRIFTIIGYLFVFFIFSYQSFAIPSGNDYNFPAFTASGTIQTGYNIPLGFYSGNVDPALGYGLNLEYNPKWWSGLVLESDFFFALHKITNKPESSINFFYLGIGPGYYFGLTKKLQGKFSLGLGAQMSQLSAFNIAVNSTGVDPYLQTRFVFSYKLPYDLVLSIGPTVGAAFELNSSRILTHAAITGSIGYRWDPRSLRARKASLVKVTSITLQPIFGARHKTYQKEDFIAIASIKNTSKKTLSDVRIYFRINEYTNDESLDGKLKIMRPGETKDIMLHAIFNENIMRLHDDGFGNGVVRVQYKDKTNDFSYEESKPFLIHSKNALVWDKLNTIGSFITHTDAPVAEFARSVTSGYNSNRPKGVPKFFGQAVYMFDALGKYGINYASDPEAPFSDQFKKKLNIDYVYYPREILSRKAGDCDDLTVLYSAVLENIGIKTALVTVPGHIFMMFNTKVPIQQYRHVVNDRNLVYEMEGQVWIPVEITMINKEFNVAWSHAAKALKKWEDSDELEITIVRDTWEEYPPNSFRDSDIGLSIDSDISSSDENELIQNDLNFLKKLNYTKPLAQMTGQLKSSPNNFNLIRNLAILNARFGNLDEAEKLFQRGLKINRGSPFILVNLGSLYYLKKDYGKAIEYYKKGLVKKPGSAQIMINIAKAYYEDKEFDESNRYYKMATGKQPMLAKHYAFLANTNQGETQRAADVTADLGPDWLEN